MPQIKAKVKQVYPHKYMYTNYDIIRNQTDLTKDLYLKVKLPPSPYLACPRLLALEIAAHLGTVLCLWLNVLQLDVERLNEVCLHHALAFTLKHRPPLLLPELHVDAQAGHVDGELPAALQTKSLKVTLEY